MWQQYVPAARSAARRVCLRSRSWTPHIEDVQQVAVISLWRASLGFGAVLENTERTGDGVNTLWGYASKGVYRRIWTYLHRERVAKRLDVQSAVPKRVPLTDQSVACIGVNHLPDMAQARVMVRRAMRALSRRERKLMCLRMADYTNAEMAEMMGTTESAITSLQFRALEKMRRALGVPPGEGRGVRTRNDKRLVPHD